MVPSLQRILIFKRSDFLFLKKGTFMEKEPQNYTIRDMKLGDGEEVHELLRQLHHDTYVNEDLGVTAERVDERFSKTTPEQRRVRLEARMSDTNNARWVAEDASGKIIGFVGPRIEDDGTRRIGALYVDKDWHGKGIAQELMQKAIDWHGTENDIHLGVVEYNDRAKAFYTKWGFEEVPNSSKLFDDLIPEIEMIRKGKSHEI
jgi:RimJ/RimL family protein N-acetyltransferase